MQSHKLVLDSIVEDNYALIAIHSSLEEHRTCYLLNKFLDLKLSRAEKDLDFKHKAVQALYSLYKFYDEMNMCSYFLVSNKQRGTANTIVSSGSLFGGDTDAITTHLIPEYKKVDYFLKIEEIPGQELVEEIIYKINQIPFITAAYSIEFDQIKNKENLIFE